jgi:hypothetical protein
MNGYAVVVKPGSERRRGAAALSGAAASVFFTLVWHASTFRSWPAALAGGILMGLVVLGSQWFMISRAVRRSGR